LKHILKKLAYIEMHYPERKGNGMVTQEWKERQTVRNRIPKGLRMPARRTFITAFQDKVGLELRDKKRPFTLQSGSGKTGGLQSSIIQIPGLMFHQITGFAGSVKGLHLFLLILIGRVRVILMMVQGRNQEGAEKNKQQENCLCLRKDDRKIFRFAAH
jgi:hypothetical protein